MKTPAISFNTTELLKLLGINTLIAIFLALVLQNDFWINLVYSQSIGLSIGTLAYFFVPPNMREEPQLIRLGFAIILGVAFGITVAMIITGNGSLIEEENGRTTVIYSFFYSIIIGSIVVFYFSLTAKQQQISNQLNIEKLKQVEIERVLAESNLKLLQAQIEPHFLFNTLSNVLSLIDSRPDDAKKMLDNFTSYLRASLSRTRENDTTFKDEVDIVNAYLSIQKIRMGDRLHYNIDIDDTLYNHPLPPLLIQPLVENSVRHGLESEIDGGHINIRATTFEDMIFITVCDSGKGRKNSESHGIGLTNVKERLTSLFQKRATLNIEENRPKGVIVTIQIPRVNT